MLSKEVCKKCWFERMKSKGYDTQEHWDQSDDELWEKGKVHCYRYDDDPDPEHELHDRYPISEIPIVCQRKLEHAVAAGMTNAK